MTNCELLGCIYEQIKDPDPDVATRTLTRWCATSKFVRDACAPGDERVWFRLLTTAFKPWLEVNCGALVLAFARARKHPRVYVRQLCRTTREYRQRAAPNVSMPEDTHHYIAKDTQAASANEPPSGFDELPTWEVSMYVAMATFARQHNWAVQERRASGARLSAKEN